MNEKQRLKKRQEYFSDKNIKDYFLDPSLTDEENENRIQFNYKHAALVISGKKPISKDFNNLCWIHCDKLNDMDRFLLNELSKK